MRFGLNSNLVERLCVFGSSKIKRLQLEIFKYIYIYETINVNYDICLIYKPKSII